MEGVAVVTGGASGIGAACCRALAAEGMRVAVLDLGHRAGAVAAEVGGRPYSADVSDEAALAACAARIEAEMGPVSVLVNNAGIIQPPVRPSALDMKLWDDVVRVDQRGVWLGCALFGRRMVERRRGSIVNIASVASLRAMPLHAYSPAKAAVAMMTATLAAAVIGLPLGAMLAVARFPGRQTILVGLNALMGLPPALPEKFW